MQFPQSSNTSNSHEMACSHHFIVSRETFFNILVIYCLLRLPVFTNSITNFSIKHHDIFLRFFRTRYCSCVAWPATEFAVASHLNTANSRYHYVIVRHFRFQKCLPCTVTRTRSPYIRTDRLPQKADGLLQTQRIKVFTHNGFDLYKWLFSVVSS